MDKLKEDKLLDRCKICHESIFENDDYYFSQTKRRTKIYVHKNCWSKEFGGSKK